MKKKLYSWLLIPVFLILTACSLPSSLSDKEAVKLVRDYFLFNHGGEEVIASVAERGEFMEDCECFPIIFKIIYSSGRNNHKTFYFYKNGSGEVSVRKFVK